MILYKIMLCIFICGAVGAGLNASGLYATAVPETGFELSEASVTELSQSVNEVAISPFTIVSILLTVGRVLAGGFIACLSIIPMLSQYGVPLIFAAMIQAPVWLVEAWGLYEFYTGYSSLNQD
jgi:hypothetical protein